MTKFYRMGSTGKLSNGFRIMERKLLSEAGSKRKKKVANLSLLEVLYTQMIPRPRRSISENCRKRGRR